MGAADLATTLISANLAKTQFTASIAVLKKQFDMQKLVIDMLDPPATRAAAAPGTGQVVDKSA